MDSMTHNEIPKDTVEELPKNKCHYCNGDGYTVEYDPRDQTGQTPMQVQCDYCHAEGFITTLDVVREALTTAYNKGVEVGREHQEDWYLGRKIQAFGGDYIVVGISRMIYDEDCEGESEWKITHEVQEVAIAKETEGDSFQKPSWHKISDLTHLPEVSL